MQKNFRETLINFKVLIIRNIKLIIFFQLISILFAIVYFYNHNTNYTYSTVYQNAFSKIFHDGEYEIKKINPSFTSGMNFYYLDHYYENIYSTEFNTSEECKKAEYGSRDYLSTKTDNGFKFSFEFEYEPKLTVMYKSNDMSKAKQCVEEYIKNIVRTDNVNLKKLREISI